MTKQATVSMAAKGGVFDLDRTVDLKVNVVGKANPTASATVIVRDSNVAAEPPVDVKRWQYLR